MRRYRCHRELHTKPVAFFQGRPIGPVCLMRIRNAQKPTRLQKSLAKWMALGQLDLFGDAANG